MGFMEDMMLYKKCRAKWNRMSIKEREEVIKKGSSWIPNDLRFAEFKWEELSSLVRAQLMNIMEREKIV